MPELTVFTHVHNEALLLPYWLRHHRRIFNHGVVVDRGSTDATLEILAELAPEWEVVRSRNLVFDAVDCDREMMELEAQYSGWKMILNTTEFLFHPDVNRLLAELEQNEPNTTVVGVPQAVMVDPLELSDVELDPSTELWIQRHHSSTSIDIGNRYLHRERDGAYGIGRHTTRHPYLRSEELRVLRYTWSPYPATRDRKLAIQSATAASDIARGLGFMHLSTAAQMDVLYEAEAARAVDLRGLKPYDTLWPLMEERFLERAEADQTSTRIEPAPDRKPLAAKVVNGSARAGSFAAVLEADLVDLDKVTDGPQITVATPADVAANALLCWRGAPLVIDLDAHPDAVLLTRRDRPTVIEILARADYFTCASEAILEEWLPHVVAAGRIAGGARPGPDVVTVVADPSVPGALDELTVFLEHPVRRGVPVFVDTELSVSRANYRLMYGIFIDSVAQMHTALDRIAALEERLRELESHPPAGGDAAVEDDARPAVKRWWRR